MKKSAGMVLRRTFSTAHVEAGECILEGLLKPEEFEDGEIDGGVKAETTLVRTDSGVVLGRKR